MVVLYSKLYVDTLKHRIKRDCFISIIIAGLCLIAGGAICFLTDESHARFLCNVAKGVYVLGGWSCIYLIFACVIPRKHKLAHISRLLKAEFQENCGELVNIGEKFTVSKHVTAQKLVLKNKEENSMLYWDCSFGTLPVQIGQFITVCTANRFVISYEVSEDEDSK